MPGSTFYLYGIPWQSPNGSFDLNSIVGGLTTTAEINWDEFLETGDIAPYIVNAPHIQIQVANGGYDLFYYIKNALNAFNEETGVMGFAEGWCDSNGMLVGTDFCEVESLGCVTPGASVWFKDFAIADDKTTKPTTAGAVIDQEYDIQTPVDFRLRAPMLPVAFNLMDSNLVTYTDLYAGSEINWEEFLETGDITPYIANAPHIQIQVANGGYDLFYYIKNALNAFNEETGVMGFAEGWCDSNGMLVGTDFCEVETQGTVPVNGAFWAKGVSSAFWMNFKPLAK